MESSRVSLERLRQVLADIGADQTLATAADHKQYMADFKGANLASLKTTVKEAVAAGRSVVSRSRGEFACLITACCSNAIHAGCPALSMGVHVHARAEVSMAKGARDIIFYTL